MAGHVYDQAFHDYTLRRSMASAQPVIALLHSLLLIQSVLDVGCSRGPWLKAWGDSGVKDYLGLDGDFLDPNTLLIERQHFHGPQSGAAFSIGAPV